MITVQVQIKADLNLILLKSITHTLISLWQDYNNRIVAVPLGYPEP